MFLTLTPGQRKPHQINPEGGAARPGKLRRRQAPGLGGRGRGWGWGLKVKGCEGSDWDNKNAPKLIYGDGGTGRYNF